MSDSHLLDNINSPEDLKRLSPKQLIPLAAEIRDMIVETVSQNGGHLAGNLRFVCVFLFCDLHIGLAVECSVILERIGVVPLPPHYLRKIEGNVENHAVNGDIGENIRIRLRPEVRPLEGASGNERERLPWFTFLRSVTDCEPYLR